MTTLTDDLPYWVAFTRIPTIGPKRVERLEAYFGGLGAAWRASEGALAAAGLEAHAVAAVVARRPAIDPLRELAQVERLGLAALTWHDERYPARLRETYDRPPVLYLRGELTEADAWCVAVVGTREATAYGLQATEQIVCGLVENGVTVVSGLARGIDAAAHGAALRAGGRTIAVLPCPANEVYPPGNRSLAERMSAQGALVSEYPPGTKMHRDSFPQRNRIMAGMTLGTVVIEADERSGALITARRALDENREVFAVPGSIFAPTSRGTNALIGQGAKLVRNADDILVELDLMRTPRQLDLELPGPDDPTEAAVIARLAAEPTHIDEIARGASLPVAAVSGALAMLELKGLVRRTDGMQYVRTDGR